MKANIIFILILSIGLFSCKKYLDIKTESNQSFIETARDCQLVLDNYSVMNSRYPFDGEASADDYYVDSAKYFSNNISIEDRSIHTWNNTVVRHDATQWQPMYFVIYNSNLILEALDNLKDSPSESVKAGLKGSALFYRAYALWNIAQIYAKPYSASTAATDPGVPIKLVSDINDRSNRGTVKQTYDRIVQDLQDALILLPEKSSVASRPSKVAANAMLARVYLSMEDYGNARLSADAALTKMGELLDYNTLDPDAFIIIDSRFNKEVIFHSITSSTNLLKPNQFDNYARIDTTLIKSYNENDLRRRILFKPLSGDSAACFFSGNYEPSNDGTFFTGLAVDEMYLIRGECYARENNTQLAMTDLNTLLRARWVTGTFVDLTAADPEQALAIILNERRKELLMRGQRWTDLRRLNKDLRFAKELKRIFRGESFTLPPNDLRYTLLIPIQVLELSNFVQNPR